MNKLFLSIITITLSTCNGGVRENNDLRVFSVPQQIYDVQNNVDQSPLQYTEENYYAKALSIFNKGKTKLKGVLPTSFEIITHRVMEDLESYDKAKKLSHTKNQYLANINEIQVDTGLFLFDEEIRVNEIYNETLEELSELNDEYYNYFATNNEDISFEDYYSVSRIRIAEEVLEKLDELVNDEKDRAKRESRATKFNIGLTLVALIPGASACTKVLEAITLGAKTAKRGSDVINSTNKIAKISHSVLRNNKIAANKIAKSMSNAKKRKELADKIAVVGGVAVAADFGTEMYYSFKSKNNDIKGRIGDGADWVLAVHFQQIRDLITENKKLIPNYTTQNNDFKDLQ